MKALFFLILAAGLALALPAQAAPRDEVMAGAFHCAGIADSHQWLDCFYGAAQPVRAELGLPPVPEAQRHLTAAPPTGGAVGDAAVRDAVMAAAFDCHGVGDSKQWLDCYYGAAQAMRARLGLSPAPQSAVPRPATPPEFGLPPRPAPMPDRVVSRMASYSFDTYGVFTVTLSNGQVWREITGDTAQAHWHKPAATYVVTIKPGAFRSFNLRVEGENGLYKVQRIR